MAEVEAFVSAPIKLAAKIRASRAAPRSTAAPISNNNCNKQLCNHLNSTNNVNQQQKPFLLVKQSISKQVAGGAAATNCVPMTLLLCALLAFTINPLNHHLNHQCHSGHLLMVNAAASGQQQQQQQQQQRLAESWSELRHQAHYMDIQPSTHFNYHEGRQFGARSLESAADPLAAAESAPAAASHIYKRSSAALLPPAQQVARNAQLVGSSRASLNPISRRMMGQNYHLPQQQQQQQQHHQHHQHQHQHHHNQQQRSPVLVSSLWPSAMASDEIQLQQAVDEDPAVSARPSPNRNSQRADSHQQQQQQEEQRQQQQQQQEMDLLRQKQHIQYHDQWPSMAGKCHKRTLNFCASVLPFNTTTFPNIIGDTNRFEVKRSLPFFGFLAKSSCNKRLDELLCLLLEPPCQTRTGLAIPPCKKFCRLALEGCNEYIPATLALSQVFDCRQYPDSNEPNVCVNLAQGSKCADDEFKCPDKTCIPRNWLCDGVRDCIFAADEANCTDSDRGQVVAQASVCSTEEFKCDGKCVPKAWKCDGERDCLDGSDEESCHARPKCGQDRFRCADGNGCIPKRWVCDGKAECRDGSDETNCEQRECSDSDFKCDNGICIPKMWRCDRQADCKDGSDERQCVYATSSVSSSPVPQTTLAAITTTIATTPGESAHMVNASYSIDQSSPHQPAVAAVIAEESLVTSEATNKSANQQQLEASLSGDVSRIIQHELLQAAAAAAATAAATVSSSVAPQKGAAAAADDAHQSPQISNVNQGEQQRQQQPTEQLVLKPVIGQKEMKKFDYELIQSSPNNAANELQQQAPASYLSSNLVGGGAAGATSHQGAQKVSPAPSGGAQQVAALGGGVATEEQKDSSSQQQQQQQSTNSVAPQSGGNRAQSNAQEERKPADSESQQQFANQQQQQFAQHAQVSEQRVLPIYRSLFKTFKNGAGQMRGQGAGARNVVAVARRRRDRNSNNHLQHQQQLQHSQLDPQGHGHAHPSQNRPSGETASQQARPQQQQQQPQQPVANEFANNGAGRPQVAAAAGPSASVASYLQLLNSRYNLRFPRVGVAAPSAVAQ